MGACGRYAGLYHAGVRDVFDNVSACPANLLLWFHNLPWTHPMPAPANYTAMVTPAATPAATAPAAGPGATVTLFEYIRYTHDAAVKEAEAFGAAWAGLEGKVDAQRFTGVRARLAQQARDAAVMRDDIMVQYSAWYHQR